MHNGSNDINPLSVLVFLTHLSVTVAMHAAG